MKIRDIKERLTILQVIRHYGLEPNKYDMVKCPFHKDKNPSLKLYYETNTFNCFGCSANGDVIEFIQLKEKITKHEAILKAKELIGLPADLPAETKVKAGTKKAENHSGIINKMFKSFHKNLHFAKKPGEYLQQRSLNPELLEVGYNSGQFHHRGRLSEEDFKACINAGLLVPYKGYTPNGNKQVYTAFANNCIIFPLKNKQNKIVSIYGRSLSEKKGEKHYYLKSRNGLYPGYLSCPGTKPKTRRLILTEAIIDAATLLQLPTINKEYEILALYGTNGLTEEHKQTIKEAKNLTEIIFFFDGDTAGRTAIEKYSKELKDLLPNIIFSEVETPGGEDVNSLHQMYDNEEYFLELLDNRKLITAETENLFLSIENPIEKEKPKEIKTTTQESFLDTENPEQIIFESTELKITIWGGIEKENLSRLKVSMHIKSKENKYRSFRDDINLYSHSSTQKLIQNIAETLEISTSIANKTITELTEKLEEYRINERTA